MWMCWKERSFFKDREVNLMASGSPFRLQDVIITKGAGSQKSVNLLQRSQALQKEILQKGRAQPWVLLGRPQHPRNAEECWDVFHSLPSRG